MNSRIILEQSQYASIFFKSWLKQVMKLTSSWFQWYVYVNFNSDFYLNLGSTFVSSTMKKWVINTSILQLKFNLNFHSSLSSWRRFNYFHKHIKFFKKTDTWSIKDQHKDNFLFLYHLQHIWSSDIEKNQALTGTPLVPYDNQDHVYILKWQTKKYEKREKVYAFPSTKQTLQQRHWKAITIFRFKQLQK